MKCPKCDYISFDSNDACPKCGNSLVTEREEMNLPGFKPAPPFLLDALITEGEPPVSGESVLPEPGLTPSAQEELMASLDHLTAGEIPSEEPDTGELKFDIEPQGREPEELHMDMETGETGTEALEYNIEQVQSEAGTLKFDLEPEAPALEQSRFRVPPEPPALEFETFEPQGETEKKADHEKDFEKGPGLPGTEPSDHSIWDTEALAEKMGVVEPDKGGETGAGELGSDQTDKGDEFFIDLEDIEPLELEIEPQAPEDKNNP
ncbi:MAG: hypothetical protein R6U38_13350 [Desulfatiglandaceae bacterium]